MKKNKISFEDLNTHHVNDFTRDDRSQAAQRAEDYLASQEGKPATRSIITRESGGWDKESLSDYNVCVVSAAALAPLLTYKEMDTERGLIDKPLPLPICHASQTEDDLVEGNKLIIKINLCTPDIIIKKRVAKMLNHYRSVGKIKVVSKKKPPELPYWVIFDLVLYDKMPVNDIVRVHGPRFRSVATDTPTNLKKRVQRAYKKAEKIIEAYIDYMDLLTKLKSSE